MYEQLYWLTSLSFGLGILIYSLVSLRLAADIKAGLVPTRLEEHKAQEKAPAAR